MALPKPFPIPPKPFICLLFLAFSITFTNAARILGEEESDSPQILVSNVPPPIVAVTTTREPSSTTSNPIIANTDLHHPLVFYMHDIIGGSNPSARAVTGIVTNPAMSGQVPFAKPNGAVVPFNNGIPQNNNNNGIINNNNIPFFTGLSGNTENMIQNNNNNGNNPFIGGNGFPFLNGAQLPSGMTLQKLMFGTLTAFDDELTEGHELGSGLLGKAQGFYVASSVDGTSQTIALTAMFEDGGYADSLVLLGVDRTAVSESHLAVIGGTGKFLNAKGHAIVKTFPNTQQHQTDGFETLLKFIVYLT